VEETLPPAPSRRRALPIALIILATLVGIASVFALWAKRQLLETESWSTTTGELIQNEDIQVAVADFITTSIYDNVDVQGALAERLPPQLAPLAGPIAGALRNVTDDVALKALQQPKVQSLWVDANEAAHGKLIDLIEDRGDFVSTGGGVVTLDLKGILDEIVAELGIGGKAVEALPEDVATIELVRSDELEAAQKGVNALQVAGWALTALTLLLFAAAIAAGRGRRRETFRAVGFSFIVIGVVALVARGLAGDALVSALSDTPATDPPITATFDIGTSLLQEAGISILAYGIVIVLLASLAGPSEPAVAARRSIAPYLQQPIYAYGLVAILLLLLFWWDPVIATHRVAPSVVLIVLALIGIEVLRRQLAREHPIGDQRPTLGHALSAAGHRLRSGSSSPGVPAGGGPAGSAAPSPQERIALLERLASLRDSGAITEDEYAAEKAAIQRP
jgi:hypothetical protein